MKKFYLVTNWRKPMAAEKAAYIRKYLEERDCVCYQEAEAPTQPGISYKYTDASGVPGDVQCVITLGGDGTLIQAARDLAGRNLPLLGINLGTLGYLTQVGKEEEIATMLDDLIAGHYHLEQRMMLDGKAYHKGVRTFGDVALNEIVITRRDLLQVLTFYIYINGEYLNQYKADGMIIATPTGSTAYNLSAGGPIVAPTASITILTPICPHTLNSRSVVLSADDHIRIEIAGEESRGPVAVFDGDTTTEMYAGDYIDIGKSELQTTLVKLKNISFLDNLRNKMAGI